MIKKILVLLLVLIFVSCSNNNDNNGKIEYTKEQAELINKITTGKINSTNNIKIKFNKDIVSDDIIAKPLEASLFEFIPSIDGKTFWESKNVLAFKPEAPLEFRKKYKATLNLKEISKEFKNKNIDDLRFNFEVLGRELFTFKGEVSLKDINKPDVVNYRGNISFTEKTNIDNLIEALSLRHNGKNYDVEIFETDDRNFSFISEDIIRDKTTKDFELHIAKEPLDISNDLIEEFQITTLEELKVTKLIKLEDDLVPKIRVEFSDDLDVEQKLNGLINVENKHDLKIQKIGNSVIIDGNFSFGDEYVINLSKGIMGRWGTKLKEKYRAVVKFNNKNPELKFASDGVFLPEDNKYKIQFYATNLKRAHIEVKLVFESNLNEFIEAEQISSKAKRKKNFNQSYINRVGVIVHNETFDLQSEKNKSTLNEIDLAKIIKNNPKGLYLIRLNFNPRDILTSDVENESKYIQKEGQIYKPIILTNIGLTVKSTAEYFKIYATDLITGKPLKGINIKLKTYYYSDYKLSSVTNSDGIATLNKGDDNYYSYYNSFIVGEKDGQYSIVKFDEMQWNLSGYDVGGINEKQQETKSFAYTSRGVYRPGDEVNLSIISRHKGKKFPDNYPLTLSVYNPQNKKTYEFTNKNNKNGFFNFNFTTKENDMTGTWSARYNIGNNHFSYPIKIETVVPYKLKVKIKTTPKRILWNHEELKFEVQSNYLFGNPAADLPLEVDLEVYPLVKKFPKYSEYQFINPIHNFTTVQKQIEKTELDKNGNLKSSWKIPSLINIPSALNIKLTAIVTEKGGRPNKTWINIPFEPYNQYVGIKAPKYGYVTTGSNVSIPTILVNTNGVPVSGRTLKYKIYRNSKNWWWHYGNDRRLKYKTDNATMLVDQGTITTRENYTNINFVPIQNGQYFIEVLDESGTGHSAGVFFGAYRYGGSGSNDKNAGTLTLTSDKEKYFVGEKAKINFPIPKEGSILFTLEKGNEIISEAWYYPNGESEMTIEIPLTKQMAPNVYASISIIQPHAQTLNDRPIRTFGVIPIMVEDRDTKYFINIKTKNKLKPKEDFVIDLQSSDKKQTQFTIAVVDEGLLDITQFKTPNPWQYFYKKIRLAVKTYDLFSQVVNANKGDVFRTFSIGGGMDYRKSQLAPDKSKKRFKPVSLFKGPILTDKNGRAQIKFKMPNYIGSVRIMVVGANENSYAKAEKTVPVKKELMVLPTLPRVIGPGEKFSIPVSVFAMKDGIGKVNVEVKTEGPLNISGNKIQTLTFDKADDKDCYFDIAAKEEVGQAKISITAKSSKYSSHYDVDISVRPSSPRIYETIEKKVKKGNSIIFKIPNKGIKGTNRAVLRLSNFPNTNFGHRLKWLIHYPYGCIEQTTSSVFPQLFLKNFIEYPEAFSREMDANINAGLERLRKFQIYSGAFSYWPYGNSESVWGTLYAAHFMTEAKKLGYIPAEDLYNRNVEYLIRSAKEHSGDLIYRVYRAYILALAGKSELSELNALRESNLNEMTNVEKWMLAASYKLSGLEKEADIIANNLSIEVKDYTEFSRSYGSALRDMAMILDASVILERYKIADSLTKKISKKLSARNWYSTQTISYSLLAIGKYMNYIQGENKSLKLKGYYVDSRDKKNNFNGEKTFDIELTSEFGKDIKVFIDKETSTDYVYSSLSWNGVPLKSELKDENKNLELKVEWLDENGTKFNPAKIKQGTTFYGKFRVKNISEFSSVEEVALLQVIPSGWEIVNTRLLNETLPIWTSNLIMLNKEEYVDIRDDRIMWFFDLNNRKVKNKKYNYLDFIVKLTAVTVGEFDLPGTLVEAMYNNDFKATKAGRKVEIINADTL